MWNLMIFGITSAVVLVNIIVFKTLAGKKHILIKILKIICVLFFIPLTMMILIPNAFWILSPLTPAIHGKVIDAETGRALPNARIIVSWRQSGVSVGGGAGGPYKTLGMTTDENGKFKIPRTVKALSWCLPGVCLEYGGMSIFAYDFDHEGVMGAENQEGNLVLTTKAIKTDLKYFANMKNIQTRIFFQISESDKQVLKNELFRLAEGYRLFEKRYPQSTMHEELFSELSSIYAQTNSKKEEIEFWEEYLRKYPSGKDVEYGRHELKWLRYWVDKER